MNNIFTLTLNIDQVNTVLRQLDQGPHAQVRQVIDTILQQVNAPQAQQNLPLNQDAEEVK